MFWLLLLYVLLFIVFWTAISSDISVKQNWNKMQKTLKQLSQSYRISELSLWELIRHKKIKSHADLHAVWLDEQDLRRYFQKHPEFLEVRRERMEGWKTRMD